MRSIRLLVYPFMLGCFFLGLGCDLPVRAAASKPKVPAPPDPRILVAAVNLANQQITITHKRTGQTNVYTVDDLSQVTVNNNPGSLKDVKVGQQVISYTERDAHTLDSLNVGIASPAPQ